MGQELEQAIARWDDFKGKLQQVGMSVEDMRRLDATEVPKWSGPLPDDVQVETIDEPGVRGEMITPPGAQGDRTLMYIHGGGLVVGSPATIRTPVSIAVRSANARAFLPTYRLAPEDLYPAQRDDIVAAYKWLLSTGTRPESVVIAGESAGGGLVCAVLLALRDAGEPLPAAAIPISPMVDYEFKGASWQTNGDKDWSQHPAALALTGIFLPGGDAAAESPINADLTGLPPLLVQAGAHECIRDDAIAFAERAKAAGVDVTLEIYDDMRHLWHNHIALPQAQEALAHIGDFLRERTAASVPGR
jgi:acetyl esterase/lipase